MKNYRAQTPQNLALTKNLAKKPTKRAHPGDLIQKSLEFSTKGF